MHLPWALNLFLQSSHFSVIIWAYTFYDEFSPEALSMNFSTVPITLQHLTAFIHSMLQLPVIPLSPEVDLLTLQTERVHVPYEQSVALRSYHQFRLIQAEELVHGNIYCDDSSSGLCSYAFASNTVCIITKLNSST